MHTFPIVIPGYPFNTCFGYLQYGGLLLHSILAGLAGVRDREGGADDQRAATYQTAARAPVRAPRAPCAGG